MDIRDLETFVVVVQSGSLSKAAEQLHLTQPGVSKRIRHIEAEFGCRLFERVGNQFLLTAEGKTVHEHATSLLRSLTELRRKLSAQGGKLSSLTIALSNSLGRTSFTSRMKQLKLQFPFVEQLQLRLLSSGKVTESVLQGESDVGIRFFRDEDARLLYEEIGRETLVIVCSSDSQWLADPSLATPDRLSRVPWITLPVKGASSSSVAILAAFLEQERGRMGITPQQRIEIDGFHATKTMVASDLGIALLPYSHVQDDIERGTLLALPAPLQATIPIYCVARKQFHHLETLREIVAFLFPAT